MSLIFLQAPFTGSFESGVVSPGSTRVVRLHFDESTIELINQHFRPKDPESIRICFPQESRDQGDGLKNLVFLEFSKEDGKWLTKEMVVPSPLPFENSTQLGFKILFCMEEVRQ